MKRRIARETAFQALFRMEFTGEAPDRNAVESLCESKGENAVEFCMDIVEGTVKHLAAIDSLIEKTAEHWVMERMAAVDRNILRAAAYELLYRKDIPVAVVINEAIEVAKKYSTAESASFINGILDKIKASRPGVRKGAATPVKKRAVPPGGKAAKRDKGSP